MAEHEFKKGDRVVFVRDDDYDGVEMPEGTLATYDDDAPTGGLVRWVRLDTGERVAADPDAIAHAEDHGTGDGSASDICAEPGCNCDLERRFPAPLLVEWASEVDALGTKEIWDSEEDAREMAKRYGQRLFRVEWTEVKA